MKSIFIVLPAFNEEKVIGKVLETLSKELSKIKNIDFKVVVVDDGSWDNTSLIAKKKKVCVLRHPINRGLGGSLATGMEFAKRQKADYLVTLDADGQHDPQDIKKILSPLIGEKADVVIGIRDLKKMPFDRKLMTFFSSCLTFLLFGVYCSDTQSGFRGFNKKAIKNIKIKTQRMEVSSEFFHEIKKFKLKLVEIPIKVIYTAYSREKGQKNVNAIKILVKLILRLFR